MAGDDSNNTPSAPEWPTSVGFNSDQLPNNTSHASDDEEAAIDPHIIPNEPEELEVEEEDEGEDLFNENFMEDYQRAEEHDRYESLGLDDSLEDERDLDQIIQDRRAAELELDVLDACFSGLKLLELLRDQDTDDDDYRPSKLLRVDFRPPAASRSNDDVDGMRSSRGRAHSGDDVPMIDNTDNYLD